MVYSKSVKIGFFVISATLSALLTANSSQALTFSEDKISKCVEALKLPDTKRIYTNTVGEKLLSQLEAIETALKGEKEPEKIKLLEIKKQDVQDQIDEKLAKKCKSFTFIDG